MRTALSTLLAVVAMSGATHAQSSDPAEMASALFDRIDADSNGQIRLDDMATFDEQVFAAGNGDDGASLEAFTEWGFGFEELAGTENSGTAYLTAARLVFDLIDYDDDGNITPSEMRNFRIAAMNYADHDGNSIVNREEFIDHHIYSMVARTVLAPE